MPEGVSNWVTTLGSSVRGIDSSRQLALGLALGAMIGIIPKDSMLVIGLLVFLILSGANLVTGAIAGLTCFWLSPWMEPWFHSIGNTALQSDWIVPLVTQFLELPVAAWTRLDNTVVFGSTTVALVAMVPLYHASYFFFARYRASIERLLVRSRLMNWIVGYTPQESLRTEQ